MNERHGKPKPIRVCFLGTYRAEYTRNLLAIQALQLAGFEVAICHQPLWHGFDDRVAVASGGWFKPAFWFRAIMAYWQLMKKYTSIGEYDLMLVGYPGHIDIYLGWILTRLRKKPLAWEVVISLYLILLERGIAKKHPISTALIRQLEKYAIRLPELVFLDSSAFIEWFKEVHAAPIEKFRLLPLGVDSNELPALLDSTSRQPTSVGRFIVLYYGSYIPNHGVTTILEAANLLRVDPLIHFILIGDGPDRPPAEALARQYQLENVTFIDWMEKHQLADQISRAGACLGSLGDTLQGQLTNNNKILEAFSLKIPVITGLSPALPDELVHGIHLYLCERGNPLALSEAILDLKRNPELCRIMGENSFAVLKQNFDLASIGELLTSYLTPLVKNIDQVNPDEKI